VWNIRDGSLRAVWCGSNDFLSVAFSPDGRHVAAGDDNSVVWIWHARTSQLVAKYGIGHNIRAVMFTPDGKGITIGGSTLQCWDLSALWGVHLGEHAIQDTSLMNQIYEFEKDSVRPSFASTLRILIPMAGVRKCCLLLFRQSMASFSLE
jgi:WD40 repeat protein